jgi:hypothetical protein
VLSISCVHLRRFFFLLEAGARFRLFVTTAGVGGRDDTVCRPEAGGTAAVVECADAVAAATGAAAAAVGGTASAASAAARASSSNEPT